MKRIFSLILVLAFTAALCACASKNDSIEKPVNFYYRSSDVTYGTADGLIRPQVSEAAGFSEVKPLLEVYLQGPNADGFAETFPSGVRLLDAYVSNNTVYLELSEIMATMTGIDLSIACACLTMTTLELVDATYVCISANGASLEGSSSITLSLSDLILQDLYTPETTE